MPNYSVSVNRTRTISSHVEISVSAKNEESAETKISERISKAESDGKLGKFDWEDDSEEDSFEYEVSKEE